MQRVARSAFRACLDPARSGPACRRRCVAVSFSLRRVRDNRRLAVRHPACPGPEHCLIGQASARARHGFPYPFRGAGCTHPGCRCWPYGLAGTRATGLRYLFSPPRDRGSSRPLRSKIAFASRSFAYRFGPSGARVPAGPSRFQHRRGSAPAKCEKELHHVRSRYRCPQPRNQ
jgi:hypothetical protein